jgi:hypothetical protein
MQVLERTKRLELFRERIAVKGWGGVSIERGRVMR